MRYFGVVSVFIVCVFIVGFFCSANDLARLKGRIKHLETRLNYQVSLRDEEYAEITERLDNINNVINVSVVAQRRPMFSETTEINNIDYETADLLKEDFVRMRKAFRREKAETDRIRREIPKIENKLISINNDVENYCQAAINNTKHLLNTFEASSASEGRIIKKLETITNNAYDNKIAHKEERFILQDMAAKVQLNADNDRKLFEKITNIELLVTNLFSHISLSLFGSSCLKLKSKGIDESKIYSLHQGFEVYCDQTTDGGGWTVFQRRINGEVDFYRNWTEYKNGFGDLSGEFWLGNDHLSLLTADGNHELRVEMEDFEGNMAYAKYSEFKVYSEDKYRLEVSGNSGTAGDSLKYHNGMIFSTFDSDNDKGSDNCADKYHGAWWYNSCYHSNLNGQYYNETGKTNYTGISWYHWKHKYYCLKSVEMKFR